MGSHIESRASDDAEITDNEVAGGTCTGSDAEMDRVASALEGVSDVAEELSDGDGEAEAEVDELDPSDDDVPLSRMLGSKGKGKARAVTEEREVNGDEDRDMEEESASLPCGPAWSPPMAPNLPTLTGRRGTEPNRVMGTTQTWVAMPMVRILSCIYMVVLMTDIILCSVNGVRGSGFYGSRVHECWDRRVVGGVSVSIGAVRLLPSNQDRNGGR